MTSLKIKIWGFLFIFIISLDWTLSFQEGLSTLNNEKRQKLKEFKGKVKKMILELPQQYMTDDAYLLRILDCGGWDVDRSVVHFQEILARRKAANVDSIMADDWSEYKTRHPYSLSTVSKENRPILYLPVGQWDLSEERATGDFTKFSKFVGIRVMEEADRKAQAMRAVNKDVNMFDVIFDLKGYTLEKHGCLACILAYKDLLSSTEGLYSEAIKTAYIINAPTTFQAIYPFLASGSKITKKLQEQVKVLGERESFEPVLLENIDLEQFPEGIQ